MRFRFNIIGAIGVSLVTFGLSFVGIFVVSELVKTFAEEYSPLEMALFWEAMCIITGGMIIMLFTQTGRTAMMENQCLPISTEDENEEGRWFP